MPTSGKQLAFTILFALVIFLVLLTTASALGLLN